MISTREKEEISFSAFLAGFLLLKRDVKYLEFSKLMTIFEMQEQVDIIEPEYDFERLSELLLLDDKGFHLIKNYDDYVIYNGKLVTVFEYLCFITNDMVRTFLNVDIENNLKKRTKVIK